jgi:CPA2 family monovalent cation:H+ antiporter-2
VLVIVGIYVIGRLVLRPLFHLVSLTRTAEMFMAAILLVVIGTATITGVAGLSMALGAFLAGLLLAETEYRHEIEVDIEPFKGLLLGLFFMSVGMGIDYRVVGDHVFWIFASVLGLFALKSVITGALCLLFGLPRHVSIETGLLLGQGGEFAFVVVGLAMSLGLVPPDVGQFMLIVAGLSMIATPLVAATGQRFAATLERRSGDQEGSLDALGALENHVIIAGFGRVGQMIARLLERETVSFIALDTDASTVAERRKSGLPVYYGDASRLEMLRRAHADRAAALVLTMNDPNANEHVVRVVRKEWSDLPVFARARDTVHATRLVQHGATDVVPEAVEATLQLGMRVLQSLGTSDEVCMKRIEAERTAALAGLKG